MTVKDPKPHKKKKCTGTSKKLITCPLYCGKEIISYSGPPAPRGFTLPDGMELVPLERSKANYLVLLGEVIAGPAKRNVLESFANCIYDDLVELIDERKRNSIRMLLDRNAWERLADQPEVQGEIRRLCECAFYEVLVPDSLRREFEESPFNGVPGWFATTLIAENGSVLDQSQLEILRTGQDQEIKKQLGKKPKKRDPIIGDFADVEANLFVSDNPAARKRYERFHGRGKATGFFPFCVIVLLHCKMQGMSLEKNESIVKELEDAVGNPNPPQYIKELKSYLRR